jgi:hypothetical protein
MSVTCINSSIRIHVCEICYVSYNYLFVYLIEVVGSVPPCCVMLYVLFSNACWVKVKVKVKIKVTVTLRLAVYHLSVLLGVKPLESHDQNFFQLNPRCNNPYVTSSLTRGCVCRLQLLLVLASAVILGPEFPWTQTTFYCISFETSPNWRARSPYLYPPGTG